MISQPGQTLLAQRMVGVNFARQNSSLTRLSTGFRIGAGRDDPAGLIASENLRATLASLEAETRALERADHVTSVADAAMSEISDLLVEAEGLAVASANTGATSEAEREANQMQLDSIVRSIDRIASTTRFNGRALLDGTATISAGEDSLPLDAIASSHIGIVDSGGDTHDLADTTSGGTLNIIDGDAGAAVESIRAAASRVASMRGEVGAFSSNLIRPAVASNSVAIENTAAAESTIRDTDIARQASDLVRSQMLSRSSIFALMQSVARGENVLSLIG